MALAFGEWPLCQFRLQHSHQVFTVSSEVREFHQADQPPCPKRIVRTVALDTVVERSSAAPVRVVRKNDRTRVNPKIVCKILLQKSVLHSRGVLRPTRTVRRCSGRALQVGVIMGSKEG